MIAIVVTAVVVVVVDFQGVLTIEVVLLYSHSYSLLFTFFILNDYPVNYPFF